MKYLVVKICYGNGTHFLLQLLKGSFFERKRTDCRETPFTQEQSPFSAIHTVLGGDPILTFIFHGYREGQHPKTTQKEESPTFHG